MLVTTKIFEIRALKSVKVYVTHTLLTKVSRSTGGPCNSRTFYLFLYSLLSFNLLGDHKNIHLLIHEQGD
jgi:hypothetical protein